MTKGYIYSYTDGEAEVFIVNGPQGETTFRVLYCLSRFMLDGKLLFLFRRTPVDSDGLPQTPKNSEI